LAFYTFWAEKFYLFPNKKPERATGNRVGHEVLGPSVNIQAG